MEIPPRQPGPLAFGDFLEHLRRQGFTIGVDHHLRLQRLLAALGGRCSPQDLKTLLCPVFATNDKEQQSFHRAFDSYYDLFQIPDESEGMIDLPPALAGDQEEPTAESDKSKRRFLLTCAALSILTITLAFLIPEVRELLGLADTPAFSSPPLPEPPISPTPEVSPTEATPQVVVTPIQTPQPQLKGATDFFIALRNAIRIAAVVIPLLCFLIYELIRYRRRKLILERARGRKPPRAWPIVAQSPDLKDYRSDRFYKVARGLRRRQVGEFQRLDVARTIAATIEARGYPNFRYRADSRAPEYLILIDRASWRDHQSHLFDALARAMEREGLFTKRYFYDGDPRVCMDDSTNRAVHLTDLQKKYSWRRLLIFGVGERLIDPVSGRLASWAAMLLQWPDRALLTTEARRDLREKTLADYFILLPATLEGLGELAERFDLPTIAEFDSWELNGEPAPPEPEGAVKIEALRPYLGEEAFQWLCACAVYPELHWDLTLHLGSLARMGAGLISEKNLLRLVRLPWFRSGSMPDELRLRLIGELEPERERAVRSAIIELLEKNPAPQGTFAADARKLEIAAQRSWLSRNNRKELRQAVGEIKQFPPNDIVRDYALVRFLESAPSSRLAMMLPRWLRKVFYEGAVPAFGVRNSVRLVVTLVAMTAIWFGASIHMPDTDSIPDVSSGGDISPNDPDSIRMQLSRVPVYEARAERDHDGLLRVLVTAETPTTGWRIYTNHEIPQRDTLEIRLIGEPPSDYGYRRTSHPSAPVICLEDRNSEIRRIIVRSAYGDRYLSIGLGVTSARTEGYYPSQQTSQPTSQTTQPGPGEAGQPDGSSANSVRTLLGPVPLYDFSAERNKDGLLRVLISAETPTVGWRIYTIHYFSQRDTLEIRIIGEPPSDYGYRYFSHPSAPLICVEDRNSEIRRIIVRAVNGDRYLTIGSGQVVARPDSNRPGPSVTTPTPSPTVSPAPLARFSVSPRSLDFGTVNLFDSAARYITISNTGTASFAITNLSIGPEEVSGFSVVETSCTTRNLQPRQKCTTKVIFYPRSLATYSTNLFINTTAGQQTVSLTGVVVVPSQPAEPTITEFTATPAGNGNFTMCYGMRDAVKARIDPDIGEVKPGERDCVTYNVPRTTNYTLTATGRGGRTVSRQLTVSVRPQLPVEIIYFRAQPSSIPEARRVQLCYGVVNARSARIDQDVGEIKPSEKDCVYVNAEETTTYTLTATGYDGKTITQSFTLRVGKAKKKS